MFLSEDCKRTVIRWGEGDGHKHMNRGRRTCYDFIRGRVAAISS
jgi:hypothetical protein